MLLLAAAVLAGNLAVAEDLAPLQLAMPDAPVLIGMNFERIRLAYAGSRYQEVLTPEYRAQMDRSSKQMRDMLGFDLSQLNEVVFSVRAGPAGKGGQNLVILRGLFDPDQPPGRVRAIPWRLRSLAGRRRCWAIRPAFARLYRGGSREPVRTRHGWRRL